MSFGKYAPLSTFLGALIFCTSAFAGSQYDRLVLFRWYQRSNGEIYFQEQYGRLDKHFVSKQTWNAYKRKPPLLPAPN